MNRVYVAGPYSNPSIIEALHNMGDGMRASLLVLQNGMAPFCPWLDYHFILLNSGGPRLSLWDMYEYSMTWLKVCNAMLILPGYTSSKGTMAEIEKAAELGIPVFYDLKALKEWNRKSQS